MSDGDHPTKIFCLGLSRTGTASLAGALELLGYRAKHFPYVHFRFGRIGAALGLRELRLQRADLETFDAFADATVIPFYKRLDAQYPGSRFILTVRDKESWLRSCEQFPRFQPSYRPNAEVRALRELVYGTEQFDPEAFARAYDRHDADVRIYFADRPDDLLVLDICGGEGWERLCSFVGRGVPAQPFPRQNVGETGASAASRVRSSGG